MSKKVFVGGLSWDTNEQGLEQAFERFGEITEVKVITDRETGKSRGFGFITFAQNEAANQAIDEMDGAEIDSRTIKVNEAQEKERKSFGGGGNGGGGNRPYGGGGNAGGGNRKPFNNNRSGGGNSGSRW